MSDDAISVSLGGLGMDEKAMLDLVNRMNEKWPGKYVLRLRHQRGQYSAQAGFPVDLSQYKSQSGIPFC